MIVKYHERNRTKGKIHTDIHINIPKASLSVKSADEEGKKGERELTVDESAEMRLLGLRNQRLVKDYLIYDDIDIRSINYCMQKLGKKTMK